MFGHVIVGYGSTGRRAAMTLLEVSRTTGLTAVDTDWVRVGIAAHDGAHAVMGDGRCTAALRRAEIDVALCVIVAVHSDAAALLVTAAVRRLTTAVIITVVRRTHSSGLATFLGATRGVVSEKLWDGSTRRPLFWSELLRPFIDAARESENLVMARRPVRLTEVGCDPLNLGSRILAVLRNGERLWCDQSEASQLLPDDHLLELRGGAPDC